MSSDEASASTSAKVPKLDDTLVNSSQSTPESHMVTRSATLRMQPPPSPFTKLSDEITMRIFRNLDLYELRTFKSCCKDWYRIIQDDSFYRTVEFKRSVDLNETTSIIQSKAHAIKCMDLDLGIFTDMQEHGKSSKLSPEEMFGYFLKAVNVESLTLRFHDTKTEKMVFDMLKTFNPKSFSLFIYKPVQSQSDPVSFFEKMLDKLFANLIVKKLYLRYGWCNLNVSRSFCQRNAQNLISLKVLECHIDFNHIFLPSVALCQNLKSLALGMPVLMLAPASQLRELSNLGLESITFYDDLNVTSESWTAFFRNMTTLKKICFHDCRAVDSCVLGEIERSCRQLEKFIFIQNYLIPKTETSVLNFASECSRLKVLRISYNSYNMELLNKLIPVMSDLDELRFKCYYDPRRDQRMYNSIKEKLEQNYHIVSGRDRKILEVGWFKKDDGNDIIRKKSYLRFKRHISKTFERPPSPVSVAHVHWERD